MLWATKKLSEIPWEKSLIHQDTETGWTIKANILHWFPQPISEHRLFQFSDSSWIDFTLRVEWVLQGALPFNPCALLCSREPQAVACCPAEEDHADHDNQPEKREAGRAAGQLQLHALLRLAGESSSALWAPRVGPQRACQQDYPPLYDTNWQKFAQSAKESFGKTQSYTRLLSNHRTLYCELCPAHNAALCFYLATVSSGSQFRA